MIKLVRTVLFYGLSVFLLVPALAQEGGHTHANDDHSAAKSGPNGGTLQSVGNYQIETILAKKGIMFMVSDVEGRLIQASAANGALTLKVDDNPKQHTYKLKALKNHSIGAAIDLSQVAGRALHMDVELTGISDEPIIFHTMATLGGTVSDAMLISLQKTCPVSGQPLGSMGAPPKIMLAGKPLFVCCAGCTAKVKADPETYLAKYYNSEKGKQIRPGVFEATLSDASAIAAQKKCPVMDEELGGMGVPQKVNVNGKAIYICCAGCAKKLTAEPVKYLSMLKKQGVTPPDFH